MSYKILVVDDDLPNLNLRGRQIKSLGYSVETARDGREALEKLVNENFDMVISDVNMPKMNGIELVQRCRQRYPQMSFLMVSGLLQDHETELKILGVPYLQKPYKLEELKAKVEGILIN